MKKIKILENIITLMILMLILIGCSSQNIQKKDKDLIRKDLPITVEPTVTIKNDTTIVFSLKATRNFNIGNELLPSSESFRVEVFEKDKLTMIWSSYNNKDFLAAIFKVEPQEIGQTKEYTLNWNRRSNKGTIISNEEVWVRLMIPAIPEFYIESFLIKLPKLSKL